MFFYASKLLWAIAAPSTFLTLLAFTGVVLALRFRALGLTLAGIGVVGLLVGGLSPLARMMLSPIENRFPTFTDDGGRIDGVVVLGGSELPAITEARGQPAFQESGERMMALADLSRRYPQARIVFSGGSGDLAPSARTTESDVVRQVLPQLGVDPSRVMFEPHSRNTAENARLSRELVKPMPGERWLLVTSAFHMPRAMGSFRAAGFPVTAYPVDFRMAGDTSFRPFRSVAEGLGFLDLVVREWVGLAAYYWSGRSSALLPAP